MKLLEEIFLTIFQTTLNASIVIIFVTLIVSIFNRRITPRIKYALWALVIIKLFIPQIQELNISNIYTHAANSFQKIKISTTYEDQKNNISNDKSSLESTNLKKNNIENKTNFISENNNKSIKRENINDNTKIINIIKYLSIIWIIGASNLTIVFLLCLFKFKRKKNIKLLKDTPANQYLPYVKEKLNIKRDILLYVYDSIDSPCIFGIIHPKIYITKSLLESDKENIKYVLFHEAMHLKRLDVYKNLFSVIALIVHWFNPLVWFAVSKIKIYREYVCDAGVLEALGEDESIRYGMTLINFSKLYLNKNQNLRLALCFENKNQIKGRIKMIKKFKNGSYKISKKAALICAVVTAATLGIGISVDALSKNNLNEVRKIEDTQNSEVKSHKFIIDTEVKYYEDINKVQEYCGFNFKVPDYSMNSSFPIPYRLIKVSDENYASEIYFNMEESMYSIKAFKGDYLDTINKMKIKTNEYFDLESSEIQEEDKRIGNINGKILTTTINLNQEKDAEENDNVFKSITKEFVWNDDGINYSLLFYRCLDNGNSTLGKREILNISDDEVAKIIKSFKPLNEIKNIDYSKGIENFTTGKGLFQIYDEEDLEKAKTLLGFNPKIKIKSEDIELKDATVYDIEDSKDYEVEAEYIMDNKDIKVTQSKNDSKYKYQSINEKQNTEKINLSNKEVYRHIAKGNDFNSVIYKYKDGDIYTTIEFKVKDEFDDESAEKFMNADAF